MASKKFGTNGAEKKLWASKMLHGVMLIKIFGKNIFALSSTHNLTKVESKTQGKENTESMKCHLQ
jgi:hypothetical protein